MIKQLVLFLLILTSTPTAQSVRFAVIGEYGAGNAGEAKVDSLITNWNVDFIVTTGENYQGSIVDIYCGAYYSDFIGNYQGGYGPGAPENRFFPCLAYTDHQVGSYLFYDYFTLPGAGIQTSNSSGTERYYDFQMGPVHFFVLDNTFSAESEPWTAWGEDSEQALWLQAQLAASTAPWKIVVMGYPPYTSSRLDAPPHSIIFDEIRWPYEEWGAHAVLAGTDNVYERILRNENLDADSIPYFISGLGANLTSGNCGHPVPGSKICYSAALGAMIVDANDTMMVFTFRAVNGTPLGVLIDSYTLIKPPCCVGATGNVDCDGGNSTDISDLTVLIDHLFISNADLCCPKEANADGDALGNVDISDLTALIDHLFISNQSLPGCL